MRLALAGRGAAMRTLTRRLLPVVRGRVRGYFARRGGRPLGGRDADDLVQDVWEALVRDQGRLLRAYDPTRGKTLEGYVGMVCRRELWRRAEEAGRKKRGGHLRVVDIDDVETPAPAHDNPERTAENRDLLAAIRRQVDAELPARGRLVFSCLYTDGLTPNEAATRIGVELQVVYNWQHRIRKLARATMAAA